jgi:hypothetical protein
MYGILSSGRSPVHPHSPVVPVALSLAPAFQDPLADQALAGQE